MSKFEKLFCIGIIIFILASIFTYKNENTLILKADNGILNLEKTDYNENRLINIGGQWDLYYDELLSPQEVQNQKAENHYVIPGRLRDQGLGDITTGYMTLHLKIIVPKDDVYGIKISSMFTASNIWINNIYYGGHGKVGKSISEEKAIYKPQYLFFSSTNKIIDIVINTSTFRDIEPNLNSCLFGTKDQIMCNLYKSSLLDVTTNTIMLFMFIFFIVSYFTVKNKKENMYFAILCLLMFLRGIVTNSRILIEIFPTTPYELVSKIAAITFYLSVTFYVLFLNDVFNNKLKLKKVAIIFGIIFTIPCIFTNNTFYDRLAILGQSSCIIIFIYILYFLTIESYKKNEKAQSNLLSFTIVTTTAIHDIFVCNSILNSHYLIEYGMLTFVAIEFILIMKDNSDEHKKLDKLYKDCMTGLYNNDYIKKILAKEIDNDNIFSIIMIDVDNFKKINDNYGHLFGDRVIIEVAEKLEMIAGKYGYVGRYGGDEFLIVLPKFSKEDAVNIANLIRISAKKLNQYYVNNANISLSIGVCENSVDTVDECINIVDNLLYRAKEKGKDCFVVN